MKDNGMQEHESFEYFKRIVPKNPLPWNGTVVLYSAWNGAFFNIAFGDGCNLDGDDMDQGFNDYMMVDQYVLDGTKKLEDIIDQTKNAGYVDDLTDGLVQVDGMQWLLKHKDWNSGDIRRFLMEALECAGYGVPESSRDGRYRDIIYIGADYDVWHEKKQVKKGAKAK